MPERIYDFIDLSDKRNIYACGDIHGCFDNLEVELAKVRFDPDAGDVLISLGDLVDRGPRSRDAINYARQPWLYRVIGNHELMTMDHLKGDSYMHTINGGGWMTGLSQEEKKDHVDTLLDAPYMLEIKTPNGQKIGFVHADLVWRDWEANREHPDTHTFCWSRTGVRMLADPEHDAIVEGIDKVFFGHNALYNPVIRGNSHWIDTGCGFEGGKLTLVNVETYGNMV